MPAFPSRYPSPAQWGVATSRRTLLRGALGAAGLVLAPGVLAACGGGSGGGGGAGVVTLGSNGSDAKPRGAYAAVADAYQKSGSVSVKINTVDHDTFQKNITSYLQGTPDDVFTWFAGYRMQYFASKGLAHQIDDVWAKIGDNFGDAIKQLSKGADGHYYFVPLYNYPWGVFYRKSVFQAKGYEVPVTWDQFIALAGRMQRDGLVPLSLGYGQGDSWAPLGTFDFINLRVNGYDFHMSLMRGKESWTDPRVKDVFDHWSQLVPFYQQGAAGRKWQEAAQSLVGKQTGMYVLGSFVAQQFTSADDLADLDFFLFPQINAAYGTDSIEAPTDGLMLSARPKNLDGALKFLEFAGSAQAENAYGSVDDSELAVNKQADTSKYSDLRKKCAQVIAAAKNVTQFADRDSDPGFISNVVEPAVASWLGNPSATTSVLSQIESQKSQYFTS